MKTFSINEPKGPLATVIAKDTSLEVVKRRAEQYMCTASEMKKFNSAIIVHQPGCYECRLVRHAPSYIKICKDEGKKAWEIGYIAPSGAIAKDLLD